MKHLRLSQTLLQSRSFPLWSFVLVGTLLCTAVVAILFQSDTAEPPDTNQALLKELSAASRELSRTVGSSVVRIEVERDPSVVNDELIQMFGGTIPRTAQGSGVVVAAGKVLTNYHVVANANRIRVSHGSNGHSADVVGFDALTDLALLSVTKLELPAVTWGSSEAVAVGDFVWAIGNPFGLQRSVTFGIVSAVEQESISESIFKNFLQTDAALNPGSSGGPLVNVDGEVVGVNTAIVGQSYQGISFAIPSDTAREIVEQLQASGHVRRGWLGVRLDDLSPERALELNLSGRTGALVEALTGEVGQSTPARKAGIRPNDVIVSWSQVPIASSVQLGRLIAQAESGSAYRVCLIRAGERLEVDVTLGERP